MIVPLSGKLFLFHRDLDPAASKPLFVVLLDNRPGTKKDNPRVCAFSKIAIIIFAISMWGFLKSFLI